MVARYGSWALLIIFVIRQVVVLGVSDHRVKKTTPPPVPMNIYFKSLRNGFHILHRIRKSYGIKIPPLVCSRCQCPPCLRTGRRGGGDDVDRRHNCPNPNKGGRGIDNIMYEEKVGYCWGYYVEETSKDGDGTLI